MIKITPEITLKLTEVKFSFLRSAGPGGQNVNKVNTAVLLKFNIADATLPESVKIRLNQQYASRISTAGELIIKADRFRTQLKNKEDAIQRLVALISKASQPRKKRIKTKPSKAAKLKRLENKKQHSAKKSSRTKRDFE